MIRLEGVCKTYHPGEHPVEALRNVDFHVRAGELVAITGSSGSGKSTLMNILGCLDSPDSGAYWLDGMDVSTLDDGRLSRIRNEKIGFIFQGFHLIPSLSALENVELPLAYRGIRRSERKELAWTALAEMGLSGRASHLPSQMSGGQQQRVAIARAVAARPPVILADEPTGNLDSSAGRMVMEILLKLNRDGRTVLLITHDPAIAAYAPRAVHLSDGHLVSA